MRAVACLTCHSKGFISRDALSKDIVTGAPGALSHVPSSPIAKRDSDTLTAVRGVLNHHTPPHSVSRFAPGMAALSATWTGAIACTAS